MARGCLFQSSSHFLSLSRKAPHFLPPDIWEKYCLYMECWLGMPEIRIAKMQASRPFFLPSSIGWDLISNRQINQNKTRLTVECLKGETNKVQITY